MARRKANVVLTDSMLGRATRKFNAVMRQVRKGNLRLEYVLYALELMREGDLDVPDPLRRYDINLLSLEQQRAELLLIDGRFWGGRYREQIQALELPRHKQSFRYCATIFVAGRTLPDTLRMWLSVLADRLTADLDDRVTKNYTVRLERSAAKHSPGVSIVYLDLGQHYEWGKPVSVDRVRTDPRTHIGSLGGPEVVAAIVLQRHIQDLIDGRRLPSMLLAGLSAQGEDEKPLSVRLAKVPGKSARSLFLLEAVGLQRAMGCTAAPRVLDPPAPPALPTAEGQAA
jgi:hypothetical protein